MAYFQPECVPYYCVNENDSRQSPDAPQSLLFARSPPNLHLTLDAGRVALADGESSQPAPEAGSVRWLTVSPPNLHVTLDVDSVALADGESSQPAPDA